MEEIRDRLTEEKRRAFREENATVGIPSLPPPAKKDLPRPAKAGDAVLDKDDIVGETNYIPGVKPEPGLGRGIRRDDPELFTAKERREKADRDAAAGSSATREAIRRALKK